MTDTALLQAAVPVFTVGGDVKGELARDLTRLEIEEDTSGLRRLFARFLAWGPRDGEDTEGRLYLDGRILDFGKEIKVAIGPDGEDRTLFNGVISAIEIDLSEETPGEVTVLAEDRLMDLRMTRRSKTYEQMSDADIANAIASEHGLTPDVSADGPTYDVVQQWNMSDLAFLRERGRLIQAEVWVLDRTLSFQSRPNRSAPSIRLTQGDNLIEAQIRADLAHQRTKIKVSGYDASQRALIDEEAGSNAIQAEISGGSSGPSTLQQAIGERVSSRVREVPLVSSEARDYARAEMLRRSRSFVTATGVALGVADLIVGSTLDLRNVGTPFEGSGYYVTRMCHTYDINVGFRTTFEAERPWIGALR
jgi:phage protein D